MERLLRSLELARKLREFVAATATARPSASAFALLAIVDDRIKRLSVQIGD